MSNRTVTTEHTDPSRPHPGGEATPPGQAAGRPVSGRRLAFGLCIAVTAIAFEAIAVATAMPAAAQQLGHVAWYAWAFSIFQVGMLLATVVSGRLCDRSGPVRPLMIGMAVFAVGLVVAGTAPTMVQLVAGRLVQGLGSGTMSVALYVVVARVFSESERPKVFSWLSTAWVMPSFIGPPVSAFLTKHLSWHWVFFAVLPLVAVTVLLVGPTLVTMRRAGQDTGHKGTDPAPIWAAGLAAVAVPLIQLAGQRLDRWSIALLVAGVVLLAVGLPRLMPPGFFRFGGGIPAVIVVRGLIAGAYFGAEAFIPLMLVETRGISLLLAGGVLTIGALGWSTGSWIQARPRFHLRRDRIVALGTGFIAIGLALMALIAWLPQLWIGLVVLSWVFAGLGMGLAYASTSLAVMSLSPANAQGRNASSLQLSEALGASVFTAVAGTIFAGLHALGDPPVTFAAVIAAMTVIALVGITFAVRIGPVTAADPDGA